MQAEIQELRRRITALAESLRKSRKEETAQFFEALCQRLQTSTESTVAILEEIARSGTMSQYCDFSPDEDRLWSEMFNQAEGILKKLTS